MKVALCFAGHMRTYQKTYESWYKHVLEPFTPDVFIHTWSNQGSWAPRPAEFTPHEDHGTVQLNDGPIDVHDINNKFQPKAAVIEHYEDLMGQFEWTGRPVYEWRDSLPKLYHGYRVNSYISTFYKVWSCNELKKQSDKQYDMIIMSRPDLNVGPITDIDLEAIHIKHSPELINGWMWNIMFVCNSENADLISNVYPEYTNKFKAAQEFNTPHKFFEPHNLLYKHLVDDHGKKIIDNLSCDIVR